ncbi:MAG: succinyl-diaminopimelate desuccinylase [Gammaproteobacteria bacterium]
MEIQITQDLVRKESITPNDAGCLQYIEDFLKQRGFKNEILTFGRVKNLWSINRKPGPLLVFLGHVDVVPTGPIDQWDHGPFSGHDDGTYINGRGTGDMKGGIACFMSALSRINPNDLNFALGFIITSDEEGPSKDGTVKVVEELLKREEVINYCLIGEPSTIETVGDNIRIGRRGSINIELEVLGKQGHAAYPARVDNPIHRVVPFLDKLLSEVWDEGNEHFPPTSLQLTNITAGVGAHNVTPNNLNLKFNLRFSPQITGQEIQARIEHFLEQENVKYNISFDINAEPFYSNPKIFTDVVQKSIEKVQGFNTALSCSGGTSDGRFIAKTGCEIVELGPKFETIHKINERIEKEELERLTDIYHQILLNLNEETNN